MIDLPLSGERCAPDQVCVKEREQQQHLDQTDSASITILVTCIFLKMDQSHWSNAAFEGAFGRVFYSG